MRKITLSIVAMAILTLVGGMAFAADTFTVNDSVQEGTMGSSIRDAYNLFATSECTGGNCNDHGAAAVSAWLDQGFFDGTAEFVPTFDDSDNSGFTPQMQDAAFGVGWGLPTAWLSTLRGDKLTAGDETADSPLTAPTPDDDQIREEWVDQIAIGYVKSNQFAQNFRSSINFGTTNNGDGTITRNAACETNLGSCNAIIDQRLEQGDTGMDAAGSGTSEVTQAFQQSFAATSGLNTTSSPEVGAGKENGIGQNVEQSGEGFFYSCLNCNLVDEHAFTPPAKLSFQNWPTRPTITKINHADSTTQTTWTP